MNLAIGSVFCEPGAYFNISHKVYSNIDKNLEIEIMKPFKLNKIEGKRMLRIDATTKSSCVLMALRGPFLDKRNNVENWYIDLPYKKTVEAKDILVPFLQYFFDGLVLLFRKFNVEEKCIRKVQIKVEKEVLNNPKYVFVSDPDENIDYFSITNKKSSKNLQVSKENDSVNRPENAHPRSIELMKEDFFWDNTDEEAPFGSDEGAQAYDEFCEWRKENKRKSITKCLSWIMNDQLEGYNEQLCSNKVIEKDLDDPGNSFLAEHYDMYTLDATVIATVLSQLIEEGRIDVKVKPFALIAITRQLHPKVLTSKHRKKILLAIKRVIEDA